MPDAPQQQEQQQQQKPENHIWSTIARVALIYLVMQWFKGMRYWGTQNNIQSSSNAGGFSGKTQSDIDTNAPPQAPATSSSGSPNPAVARPPANGFLPLWMDPKAVLDLHVYLSQEEEFSSFADVSKLVWKQENIIFGNKKDVRYEEKTLDLSPEVQNNGSLYAHMYLTYKGHSPNPAAKSHVDDKTLYSRKLLTRFQPKQKVVIKKNLVSGKKTAEEEEKERLVAEAAAKDAQDSRWVSYWWKNLTISLVNDIQPVPANSPPIILKYLELSDDNVHYYPVFYADDFWLLSDQLQPINNTVKSVNLTLKWEPKSFWYFQLLTVMDESFENQMRMMGSDRRESEQMKSMFSDTNPILLGVTFAVSLLHSIFDFLAFKNDISFWKDKKNMDGMSFRSIILNVAFQLVIFLYLLDNETSWMIIISNGIGLVIEAWKINKTVIIKTKNAFPFVEFIDKYKPSKLAKKTRKYDEMAFRYLAYILYPCLIGYTIYSALYEEHKGWYSFIIGTLVGFVYMFGFISMTPQLFINYKLKSVAHMPWKTFMYKALNTFIDDLFAFVIKMPWLHRLACLRGMFVLLLVPYFLTNFWPLLPASLDDVVFFIYLYQRFIYVEDKRRRNEFGQVGDADAADDSDFDDSDDEKPQDKSDADGSAKSKSGAADTPEGDGAKLRKGKKVQGAPESAANAKKEGKKTK
ncbi:Cleft lip and palate transmembrane protein 1 like protein [Entophlyctis sp. JEL0112]|nr:Cleft lip and palate transmembrane protein 1 like protein [Entophlyctis sp. JEL0112]